MRLEEFIHALVDQDALTARQWIADAERAGIQWNAVPEPVGLDQTSRIVAAGIVEMLAERSGSTPPAWTATIGASEGPILLVRAAATMAHLRRLCETAGPEPLRRRGILAPPDFLTAA